MRPLTAAKLITLLLLAGACAPLTVTCDPGAFDVYVEGTGDCCDHDYGAFSDAWFGDGWGFDFAYED